jgi:hypothetical protein
MRAYCLNKEELNRLIEVELEGRVLGDSEISFRYLLDDWQSWDIEFVCLATSLSQILERILKQELDAKSTLEWIYSLSERTGLFTVEGFDEDFVAHMLLYVRQTDLSIEENLVEIRNEQSEYIYPQSPQ